jgi:hypothetical protein
MADSRVFSGALARARRVHRGEGGERSRERQRIPLLFEDGKEERNDGEEAEKNEGWEASERKRKREEERRKREEEEAEGRRREEEGERESVEHEEAWMNIEVVCGCIFIYFCVFYFCLFFQRMKPGERFWKNKKESGEKKKKRGEEKRKKERGEKKKRQGKRKRRRKE